MSKQAQPRPDPAHSLLRDLRAHRDTAEALEATAPDACARHGTGAILAEGRPCGAGFWSFQPPVDVWEDLAAEGQARFRGYVGEALDPGRSIGRVPRK